MYLSGMKYNPIVMEEYKWQSILLWGMPAATNCIDIINGICNRIRYLNSLGLYACPAFISEVHMATVLKAATYCAIYRLWLAYAATINMSIIPFSPQILICDPSHLMAGAAQLLEFQEQSFIDLDSQISPCNGWCRQHYDACDWRRGTLHTSYTARWYCVRYTHPHLIRTKHIKLVMHSRMNII